MKGSLSKEFGALGFGLIPQFYNSEGQVTWDCWGWLQGGLINRISGTLGTFLIDTCPPMQRCHWQAISRLAWSASTIRKVEAVNSRSYFRISSLIDLGHEPDDWESGWDQQDDAPSRTATFAHVGTARVCWTSLQSVIESTWLCCK